MTACELVRDFRSHGTLDPWCRYHSRKASDCMTALEGELAAAKRGRKEAEDTVEALRADLEEEHRNRYRAEVQLGGVRAEVKLWASYAEEPEDSHKSMRRIEALVAAPEDPSVAGVAEALQDTTTYIQGCLNAKGHLDAVREVVRRYNHPGNETFGSLVAMQKITELLAASTGAGDATYLRDALRGTEGALRAEMIRCQAAEAKLVALEGAIESTTVGEWRDMVGYKRLHALLADRAVVDDQDAPSKLKAVRLVVEQATEHASRFTGDGDDGPRGVLYAEAVGFRRIRALVTPAPDTTAGGSDGG